MSATMSAPGMPGGGMPSPPPGGAPPVPGMPAGMAGPRPNVGATQPQSNPGNLGAAMLDIRNGLEFFQRALPNIPMGSPVWEVVHGVIGKVVKIAGEAGPQSLLNQSAQSLIRDRAQNPMQSQVAKMFPPGGGQQGPAMPTPPAAAE